LETKKKLEAENTF